MIKYLVQDIEAIPETELQGMWEESQREKAALGEKVPEFPPIWAHKVICIGMLVLDHELKPVKAGCAAGGCAGGKSEKEMIERWSDVASGRFFKEGESLRLVDWSGSRFDVPVLQTRAFRYGIPMKWLFDLQPDRDGKISYYSKEFLHKYQGKHDDVSELWTRNGAFMKPKLAHLAKLMGLPGKLGIDGTKVYDTYKLIGPDSDAAARIDTYCMQDVFETAFVFQRFMYMTGKLSLDAYRAAATSVLDCMGQLLEHQEFLERVDRDAVLLQSGIESPHANHDDSGHDHLPSGDGSNAANGTTVLGGTELHGAESR